MIRIRKNTLTCLDGDLLFFDCTTFNINQAVINMLSMLGVKENVKLNRYFSHPNLIDFFKSIEGTVYTDDEGLITIIDCKIVIAFCTETTEGLKEGMWAPFKFSYENGKITIERDYRHVPFAGGPKTLNPNFFTDV